MIKGLIVAFAFSAIWAYPTEVFAKKRLLVKYRPPLVYGLENGESEKALNPVSLVKKVDVSDDQLENKIEELKNNPNVLHVEEDRIFKLNEVPENMPNPQDPFFVQQWHYFDTVGGIGLPGAWEQTGLENVVVAVLDTGILNHSDVANNVLPGVDFIHDPVYGNDGDGRDQDPTDPGDWVELGDLCYEGGFVPSSWHGTHVAGTIAAEADNDNGGTGVNPGAQILPVRVLGKCGGYMSDIIDAMRWAAGISIDGMEDNSTPAKIINLSLGTPGGCGTLMQEAINEIRSLGVLIVVAAGNSGLNLDFSSFSPANCHGVVTVAASNIDGELSSYSNHGKAVDITAPGGEGAKSVFSLGNTGMRTAAMETYVGMSGTSMASPHVAGVISLIYSANPNLSASEVEDILKVSARSMDEGDCPNNDCGPGIIDASAAVKLALETESSGEDSFTPGQVPQNGNSGIYTIQESKKGGCGSVEFVGSGGSGGGPGSSSFIFSLLMGVVAAGFVKRPKKQKAQ